MATLAGAASAEPARTSGAAAVRRNQRKRSTANKMSWVIDLCHARSSDHTADRGDIVADIRQLQSDVASLKRMWEHGATTSSDNAAGDTGTKRTKGHSVNVKVEADSPVLPAFPE